VFTDSFEELSLEDNAPETGFLIHYQQMQCT
jgi:hypothetical protein